MFISLVIVDCKDTLGLAADDIQKPIELATVLYIYGY
jgi:hypothetical protein